MGVIGAGGRKLEPDVHDLFLEIPELDAAVKPNRKLLKKWCFLRKPVSFGGGEDAPARARL